MIFYEDYDILVCCKPAGIAVQSARTGQMDLVSILRNYLAGIPQRGEAAEIVRSAGGEKTAARNADSEGTAVRSVDDSDRSVRGAGDKKTGVRDIYVVHRLDQPVEGILVFAKTKRAASELSRQFADGSAKKVYRAVCCGLRISETDSETDKRPKDRKLEYSTGIEYELVDYLAKDGRTNTSSVTEKGKKDAKRAKLCFSILDRKPVSQARELVLAEIRLKTGRHHQIRVQMVRAGLPLAGDRKYHPDWEGWASELPQPAAEEVRNPALCAAALTFRHPVTGEEMAFETQPQGKLFALFSGPER